MLFKLFKGQLDLPGDRLLTLSASYNNLGSFRVSHLLQTGENLLAIDNHGELTLLFTGLDADDSTVQILFQFSSKTCCFGLLPSRCTILDQDIHTPHSFSERMNCLQQNQPELWFSVAAQHEIRYYHQPDGNFKQFNRNNIP